MSGVSNDVGRSSSLHRYVRVLRCLVASTLGRGMDVPTNVIRLVTLITYQLTIRRHFSTQKRFFLKKKLLK